MKERLKDNIVVEPGAYPEKHELYTAEALSKSYGRILFKRPINQYKLKSADIEMINLSWEIKAPRTHTLDGIEQALKRATKQSENIILDSFRVKTLRDMTVLNFLTKKAYSQKTIKRLIFVNRKRQVLEIKI